MSAEKCSPISSAITVSTCLVILFLLSLDGHSTSGLSLTSMNVSAVADVREEMNLDCRFDLGNEELYAVKWYKDDNEFFRYLPGKKPKIYPVAGVHLVPQEADCSLDHCMVRLERLSREHTGGAYRCEISSEGPSFHLVSETHNVTVAALPRENPRIEGLTTSYTEGDTVTAKCVSDLSDPAPILSWYINGQSQALLGTIGETKSSKPNSIGLVSRSITLHFLVERKHSRGDGTIELRCESALPGVPLAPQVTTFTIPLRSHSDPQVINNQKLLHWYSSSCSSSSAFSGCVVFLRTILTVSIVWRWCLKFY